MTVLTKIVKEGYRVNSIFHKSDSDDFADKVYHYIIIRLDNLKNEANAYIDQKVALFEKLARVDQSGLIILKIYDTLPIVWIAIVETDFDSLAFEGDQISLEEIQAKKKLQQNLPIITIKENIELIENLNCSDYEKEMYKAFWPIYYERQKINECSKNH